MKVEARIKIFLLREQVKKNYFHNMLYMKKLSVELLKMGKQKKVPQLQAEGYYWKGILEIKKGDYLNSWDDLHKSYEILKKEKKEERLSYIYNGMGLIARAMEDYMGALDFFDCAMTVLRKYPDNHMYCIIQNNIGDIYMTIRDYKRAIRYFNRANNMEKDDTYEYTHGIGELNLGIAYRKLGELRKSKEHLNNALIPMNEMKYYVGIGLVYENLTCIEFKLKRYREAVYDLAKVLEYLDEYGDEGESYENKNDLIEVLNALGEESVLTKRLWKDYQRNIQENRYNNCAIICNMAITYARSKDWRELLPILYNRYHYHSQKHREIVKIYQEKSAGFRRKI